MWDKVNIKGEDECWEWRGLKDDYGYGKIKNKGKEERTHRLIFIMSGGILTEEKNCVCHTCDNPSCCNPKHLWAGSKADNNLDRMKKGRTKCKPSLGEDNPHSKLTKEQVCEIRKLCAEKKLLQKEISCLYGVGWRTVNKIHNRKTWAWLL